VLETLRDAWDFFLRKHLSLTLISLIFAICLLAALATGYWLPTRLAYVILLGLPLAWLWARLNARGLQVTVERPVDRLQVGQEFFERITIKNNSWLGKLWLEVDDPCNMPGYNAKQVLTLGPRESRSWRMNTLCRLRGLYTIGPLTITTGDPFGFFSHTVTYGRPSAVLIYPRATELPNFYVPPANLPGEGRFRKRTHYVTPNASGIREYAPGDSFNRIHWPTVARTQNLMVKLFELDPASDIWIILDLEKKVQVGEGEEGTEEYAVQIAASVARFFLVANRSVGFISFGDRLFVEEAERGAQHFTRILEALALSRAEGDVPLASLINEEARRFGRHTTVVVITASTSEDWVGALQFLGERGVKVAAVLLEPSTFGGEENSLMVFGTLAASDVYTYLVRRSEDLMDAFAMGMEGGGETVGRR
jgi:uncharacterized protein (DUF58 family)